MDQRHGHKARHETSRTCSKLLRWWFCTTSTNGLLLAGTPDKMPFDAGQLSRAGTDHATAVEVEQVLGHLGHGQVLEAEQRFCLYRLDGVLVMVRVWASNFSARTECGVEAVLPVSLPRPHIKISGIISNGRRTR